MLELGRRTFAALGCAASCLVVPATAATPGVATGHGHTLAVDAQGRVLAWGSDSLGQLGQSSRLQYETPVAIAGLPPISAVSARFQSVAALDRNGNVWTWGLYGLGERSFADPAKPSRVLGISGVTRVESGFKGTAAIRTDAEVWGWGRMVGAQRSRPVRFAALGGAIDIAVGYDELAALKQDGTVWQLGGADLGQFVTGTSPTTSVAARIAGLPAMVRIYAFNESAGDSRFGGIDQNGEVWIWGCWNASGCVAAKAGAARKASGLPAKATSLALDYRAIHASLENGSVVKADLQATLGAAFAGYADFAGVGSVAGHDGTLYALRANGGVDSIGRNTNGELGIGSLGGSYTTRQSVLGLAGIVSVAASQFAGFAVRSDGVVFGWGDDYSGAISGAARFGQTLPQVVPLPGGAKATRVAAGARASFAIAEGGALYGWGENFYKNLGVGNDANQGRPALVPITQVVDVAGGVSFSVLVRADGFVYLKDYDTGAFGPMAGVANARRVFVAKTLESFTPLQDPAFALDANGVLHGFGYDNRGYGIFTQAMPGGFFRSPAPLNGIPLPVKDFSIFSDHALALLSDGTVVAWGRNHFGQLGDGTTDDRPQPARVPGLANVVAVAAGACHSLALRGDGTVWSWGCNANGELADGTRVSRPAPQQVAQLDGIVSIAAGYNASFAVRSGGLAFAWGNSSADTLGGTLGDGALVARVRPVLVSRENGLGNVDRDDWYLDLDPSVPNQRPAFASRTFATNTTASADLQSVNAAVIARAGDIGKNVGTYVLGRVSAEFLAHVGATPAAGSAADRVVKRAKADGDFILAQLTPSGWQVVTGQLTALVNGTLNAFNGANNILNNTPPLAPGSRFCIGYGTDANQMLAGETLAEVLALPGAASDVGFPCALSGVYVSGPAASKQGTPVKFNATVVGAGPTGTVQLRDGAGNLGGALTLVEQNAAVATASQVVDHLSIGDHSIGASYSGDSRNAAASADIPLLHSVEGAGTGTSSAIAGPASSTVGDAVTFIVTVAGNNPSGFVQLRSGGAALGPAVPLGSTSTAQLVATGLAAGTHAISAAYSGDATNLASTSSTVEHVVAPAILASVALSASPDPANSANTVVLTAAVTGNNPAGSVTFRDGNDVLGSAAIAGGSATLALGALAAGVHTLTAEYSGDGNNPRVTSPALVFAVELAQPTAVSATALSIAGSPSTLGQTVTLSASVGGNLAAPTGTVEFRAGGAAIPGCTSVSIRSGAASCMTNALAAGNHSIAAVYSGDGVYLGSSSAAQPVQVTAGAQALSVSPLLLDFGGQSVNTTTGTLAATFTNTSGAAITIASTVAWQGFNVVANTCTTLQPQASCVVTVSFTPPREGPLGGQLALGYAGGGPTGVAMAGVGERNLVTHYYRSILRRAPDAGGKAFWQGEAARMAGLGTNVNETWFAMAMSFYASAEYASLGRDNAGFVTDLYNTFFNRAPDAGGLGYWTGLIDSGMPREVALAAFMFSAEFTGFTLAIFGNSAARAEVDAAGDYYRGLLGRLPDSVGFTHWVQQFRTAQCSGAAAVATQADLVSGLFVGSGEYAARNRTDSQYVGDLYNAFLRRGGDLGGVQFWINQLVSGARTREQLRAEFRTSAEFQARVAAMVASGCVR